MHSIEATQALEPMLAELEKGQPVEIRRGNVPVAVVYAVRNGRDPARVRQAVEDLKRLRKGITLGGLKIQDLINEGRP